MSGFTHGNIYSLYNNHMIEFYSRKKVVVTGGASFIGSHLVEKLIELGSNVIVIDDMSSGNYENLKYVSDKITILEKDLRVQSTAADAFRGVDYVFHLANIHGGRGFIETHPGEISQNFLIDGNVFYAAHSNGVRNICYASSACVYPTNLQELNPSPENRYLSEEMADPFKIGGANSDGVYGWAKFMGELALKSYNEQFGLKGVSCRLFTVYGPRENESHAIIAFIARAILRQDPYVIWGSGQQDRNFTYVDDVVEGMLRATARIDDCSAINIGTSEITKIKDAVETVCALLNFSPKEFFFDKSKPEGVAARAASTSMQENKLGWSPQVSFEKGIAKTIEWYQENVNVSNLKSNFEAKLMER